MGSFGSWVMVGCVTLAGAGCAFFGGSDPKRGRSGGGAGEAFECNERRAAYQVSGGMMGAEYGVRMTCDGNVPRVEEARTNSKGEEKKRSGRISVDAWEKTWGDIEQTGWRNVGDCDNPDKKDKDPFYVFEIGDSDKSISVTCKAKQVPFPHDTWKNAIDEALAELPVDESY
jgi:hypothetical protein